MAIVDINCLKCDHTWEDLVRSVSAMPNCPKCGSALLRIIPFTKGPTVKGHAQQRIENRALRANPDTGTRITSVVPRSYRKSKG